MPRKNSTTWAIADPMTAARLNKINADFDDLYANGDDRGRIWEAASLTALKIDIASFSYRVGEDSGIYAGGTDITVTNTTINYVEINISGTIQINTTGWTSTNARLGKVTASGGVITNIEVWKPDVIGGSLGGDPSRITLALTAGENITAGDPIYVSASDGKVYKTDTSNSAKSDFLGFINTTVTTGNLVYINTGGVDSNQTGLTVNQDYFLDDGLTGAIIQCSQGSINLSSDTEVIGQTITVTGNITKFEYYVGSGYGNETSITVNVYEDSSKAVQVGTATGTYAAGSTGREIINLSVTGLDGTYYFEIPLTDFKVLIRNDNSNPYAGGTRYSNGSAVTGDDVSFRITYDVEPVVGGLNIIGTKKVGRAVTTSKMLINTGGF